MKNILILLILLIISTNSHARWKASNNPCGSVIYADSLGEAASLGAQRYYECNWQTYTGCSVSDVGPSGTATRDVTYSCTYQSNGATILRSGTLTYLDGCETPGFVVDPNSPNNACIDPNQTPDCPAAGQNKYLESERPYDPNNPGGSSNINISGDNGFFYDENGCKYTVQTDSSYNGKCGIATKTDGSQVVRCSEPYKATGDYELNPIESSKASGSSDNGEITNQTPKTTEQNYTNDVTPTQTSNDGSGTQIKVDEQKETIQKPTYEVDNQTEYVRRDGDLIEKNTKTTTKTYSDGSIEITQETTYQETSGAEVKIRKSDGTLTTSPTNTKTSGTTTTTKTDATGKVISTTSIGTGGAGTDNGSIIGGNDNTQGTDSDPVEDEKQEDCMTCTFDGEGPGEDGLYTPGTDTFDSVITDFKTNILASPVIASATGFFDVDINNSSCPVWSADIPMIGSVTIDIFCHAMMEDVYLILKIVLLLGYSFVAFRWALI